MAEPVVSEVLPTFDLHAVVRRIAERLQVDEDTASLLIDREHPQELELA